MIPQDTTHLIQRPRYQRGGPCQDPAGNQTTQRPPNHRIKTQTAVVWSCLPFIRSDQNHLAKHNERGEKTRQTSKETRRQHQGMDWPRVRQVPKGSREQGKMEETGCKNICGAPVTLAAKGMMMMMMMNRTTQRLPGHRKETQTAVVWKCLLFIRFCPKPFCKAR